MKTRVSIAVDDPMLAHTEDVKVTADLQPGDLAVAINRAEDYPPGYLLTLYEMTASGLISRETQQPAESDWADGMTILRIKI